MSWITTVKVVLILCLVGVTAYQALRIKALKKDNKLKDKDVETAEQENKKAVTTHNEQQQVREEAQKQKDELESTEDDDLADRADNLFP